MFLRGKETQPPEGPPPQVQKRPPPGLRVGGRHQETLHAVVQGLGGAHPLQRWGGVGLGGLLDGQHDAWLKIKPGIGPQEFWPMFPLARVPFGAPNYQPFEHAERITREPTGRPNDSL